MATSKFEDAFEHTVTPHEAVIRETGDSGIKFGIYAGYVLD